MRWLNWVIIRIAKATVRTPRPIVAFGKRKVHVSALV